MASFTESGVVSRTRLVPVLGCHLVGGPDLPPRPARETRAAA